MAKIKPEYSYVLAADAVTVAPKKISLSIDAAEVTALCKRLGITDIRDFEAVIQSKRMADGCTIHISGAVKAMIEQPCVVTLEPVIEPLDEIFDAYFLDEERVSSFLKAQRQKKEMDEDALQERELPEDHEDPEPIIGGKIDVGELVAQALAVGINPYPRSDEAKKRNPDEPIYKDPDVKVFAVLKDYKFPEGKG